MEGFKFLSIAIKGGKVNYNWNAASYGLMIETRSGKRCPLFNLDDRSYARAMESSMSEGLGEFLKEFNNRIGRDSIWCKVTKGATIDKANLGKTTA
jgi:hypothetical protein